MILPLGMNYTEASIMDDELLIHQYEIIFGNDDNISDEKKIKVINSMMDRVIIELVQPKYQNMYANQILEQMKHSDDDNEKQVLKAQFDGLRERLLKVGIVLADEYKSDTAFWDLELDRTANSPERSEIKKEKQEHIRQVVYNDDDDDVSEVSHQSNDPFKGRVYQKYWCHNGLLLCTSTTYNEYMRYGEIFTTEYTLPSESWYGQLIPYHKVKNLSGSYQSGVETESWISVNSYNGWVDSCYDDNVFNFSPSKIHYWSVCNSAHSNSENIIYHTLFIN